VQIAGAVVADEASGHDLNSVDISGSNRSDRRHTRLVMGWWTVCFPRLENRETWGTPGCDSADKKLIWSGGHGEVGHPPNSLLSHTTKSALCGAPGKNR
jgi:hypothetical protein